ncbi:hypothetical protein Pelo_14664 [Pelomyxa schiedti]|nr:hypothetical protein Pelo_14664 [Pelomyxa schiedti]
MGNLTSSSPHRGPPEPQPAVAATSPSSGATAEADAPAPQATEVEDERGDGLPITTEILSLVLSLVELRDLPSAALVCHRWRRACRADCVWRSAVRRECPREALALVEKRLGGPGAAGGGGAREGYREALRWAVGELRREKMRDLGAVCVSLSRSFDVASPQNWGEQIARRGKEGERGHYNEYPLSGHLGLKAINGTQLNTYDVLFDLDIPYYKLHTSPPVELRKPLAEFRLYLKYSEEIGPYTPLKSVELSATGVVHFALGHKLYFHVSECTPLDGFTPRHMKWLCELHPNSLFLGRLFSDGELALCMGEDVRLVSASLHQYEE